MSEAITHRTQPPDEAAARRRLLLSVGVVGAALLLVGAWLVPGGGSEPLPPATPSATEDEAPDDEPTPDEQDLDDELAEPLPTVTYEVYLARDPFEPVVPEDMPQPAPVDDPADPDPTDPDPTDPDPTDPDPTDPSDPTDPTDPRDPDVPRDPSDPTDPDDPDRCEGDEEVVCNGHVVSLLDITEEDGTRVAVIQVDTTVYEVRTGESFAERFRLLEVGTDQARVLFGDEDFTLRRDERVLK